MQLPPKPIRALLIAEMCNPQWVSVPLEGWSHALAIAAMNDTHLVTQIRNRQAIIEAGLVERREFTAIDSEALARPFYNFAERLRGGDGKGWTTLAAIDSLAYPYFEHMAWKQFGSRIQRGEFDIVHRLTPLNPTMPSLLAPRCAAASVPFVIGPLHGGVPWPREFDAARREEKEWLSYIRNTYKLLPGYLTTRRAASAILIGSRDTLRNEPRSFRDKCFYIPENAINPRPFSGSPRANRNSASKADLCRPSGAVQRCRHAPSRCRSAHSRWQRNGRHSR